MKNEKCRGTPQHSVVYVQQLLVTCEEGGLYLRTDTEGADKFYGHRTSAP
jgi:hypothetical protein